MSRNIKSKFETYKADGSPFFFYIDVIPLDLSQYEVINHINLLKGVANNSIMPLPLRVDRVFNGESSIIIRPKKPISFTIDENQIAIVNPAPFIRNGLEKLLVFTEIRSSEEFSFSLTHHNAKKWWDATKYLYGRLTDLEEDFAACLRAYLHTVLKAKINEEDLVSAAISYCELIRDICYKRIDSKKILVEIKDKIKYVNLYKKKEAYVYKKFKRSKEELLYPGVINIEIFDTRKNGFKEIEKYQEKFSKLDSKILTYIPLLFYDDLLECMLQNIEKLVEGGVEILDPSYLIDQEIILLIETNKVNSNDLSKYSWLREFNEFNLDSILKSIEPTFPYF
jgi:hypothetical protein